MGVSRETKMMKPDRFAAQALAGWPADVSRETLDRLRRYEAALRKWQAKINLVGPATLPDLWRRHFLDSAQLYPLLPADAATVVDLGSGAGFPGLVLAVLADCAGRALAVNLVESDARKAAFLVEAAREAGVAGRVRVHAARAEALAGRLPPADAVTARALAPLDELLGLAAPLLKPDGLCLFLKGARVEPEIAAAEQRWSFDLQRQPSWTDPEATVLLVRAIRPR